jgi:hypothetical protein
MKQIVFFLFVLLFVSCKKDKDNDSKKTILLSEINRNGDLNVVLKYTQDNKLMRYEGHSGGTMNAYLDFSYDEKGHIETISSFEMPGNVPAIKILVDCDAEGRMTSVANYDLKGPTPNSPYGRTKYSYNASGWINNIVQRDKDDKLISSINLTYFPDGNLKETQEFKENGGPLWLAGKKIYSVPGEFNSVGTQPLRDILGPEIVASFISQSIQSYSYDQNGVLKSHQSIIMSGREFNEDGSLKKQVQTHTSIKPVEAPKVNNASFEYIMQ